MWSPVVNHMCPLTCARIRLKASTEKYESQISGGLDVVTVTLKLKQFGMGGHVVILLGHLEQEFPFFAFELFGKRSQVLSPSPVLRGPAQLLATAHCNVPSGRSRRGSPFQQKRHSGFLCRASPIFRHKREKFGEGPGKAECQAREGGKKQAWHPRGCRVESGGN